MSDSPDKPIKPAPRRLRRWVPWTVAVAIVGAALGLYRLTRPDSLAAIILPRAAEALGGQVDAREVRLTGLNELTLEGVTVRAPGWPGLAGELLKSERIEVRFAILPLLLGELRIRTVRSTELLLRLTENEASRGEFSVMALECWGRPRTGSGGLARPETISIEDLRIENGRLAHGRYTPIGDIGLRGTLTPSSGSETAMRIELSGRGNSEGALLVRAIRGEIDPSRPSARIEVDDLRLAEKELPVAPLIVRDWLRQVGFEGEIARAVFAYSPDEPPFAEIDLADLALNLALGSIGGDALSRGWSGFADGSRVELDAIPRMKLRRGTLRISPTDLVFDRVSGELGADDPLGRVRPVPFEGRFSMRLPKAGLGAFDWEKRDKWVEAVARTAPFDAEIEIQGFESGPPDSQKALFLPNAVTRILSDFTATKWRIQMHAGFSRDEPGENGEPAPLRSRGGLTVSDGIGAFVEFPYQLEQVEGVFEYEDDDLRVVSVNGVGSGGAKVTISGELKGLSTGAEIDLQIGCDKAPIDDRLLESFPEAPRRALSLLFDRKMMRSMNEARLLPGPDTFPEVRAQLAATASAPGRENERDRLTRTLEAGPFDLAADGKFELHGTCGLDIRVYSPPGFDVPVEVSGAVREINASILFARFPYPLRLRGGEVEFSDEAIDLGESGLVAVTPAGGILNVGGRIEIPRLADGERALITNITIQDKDDVVNPALLAAIPPPEGARAEGWPGKEPAEAARFLTALGLRGSVGFEGTVKTRADGDDDFDIELAFSSGIAQPDEAGRALLSSTGLPWPPEFALVDCSAQVKITPRQVLLDRFSGRNGGGSIEGSGAVDLTGPDRAVRLKFTRLPIGRAFEGFLSSDPAEAERRFKSFAPEGTISGEITRTVDARGARTEGSLVPDRIEITLAGSRVRAERTDGEISVGADALAATSLRFSLSDAGEADGTLSIDGPLDKGRSAARPLSVSLERCRVESPIVRHLLDENARGVLDLLRSRSASGSFSADYTVGAATLLSIRPHALAIGEADARVAMTFDDSSEIRQEASRAEFRLGAALDAPRAGRIAASGSYDGASADSARNLLKANLRIEAGGLDAALRQQLPPPLDLALGYTDMLSEGPFTLDLPEISLDWPASGSAAEPDEYALRGGSLGFTDAAFSAGTRISDARGRLALSEFTYTPRKSRNFSLKGALSLDEGRAFDRPFGASAASIESIAGRDGIEIRGDGDIAFGRYDLLATVDFAKSAYEARIRIADADFDVIRSAAPLSESTARSDSRLTGIVSLRGSTSGSAAERTGSGQIVIRNARLASLPFAMRALQLTQLMPPLTSTVSASQARFDIQGNTATITSCRLAAGTIDLEGTGTLDIPTFGIGLRLFAVGTVPLVSSVIGEVTKQIFAIDISGTLAEPKAALAPLPGMSEAPTPPPADEVRPQGQGQGPGPGQGVTAVPGAEEPKKP